MKILYTIDNFLTTGPQIIAYTINAQNIDTTNIQKKVSKTYPDAKYVINSMFKPTQQTTDNKVVMPQLGDVVWAQTSGNKWIAACITQETPDSKMRLDAITLCLKSIRKKCQELNHPFVSFNLFGCEENIVDWIKVYPLIEKIFETEQVFSYQPNEATLLQVLDLLPGEKMGLSAPTDEEVVRFGEQNNK